MGLLEDLRKLSEQVKKRQPNTRGEQATKQALILPFLAVLGYDVHDPAEVQPEYTADFGKKRSAGPTDKVDYAVHLGGLPVMFLECKAVDAELQFHRGQLASYFNSTLSVKVAVLTNGIRYLFFTDLEEPNMLSEKPFFEFDVLSFSDPDADTLEAFTKARFDPVNVRNLAEDIIYTGKLTRYVNDLLRNPSENFTKFLLNEIDLVGGKRLVPKMVEKFVPIVRKAIQATLLDMATRSIRQQTDAPVVAPTPAPTPVAGPVNEGAVDPARGVVTTAEELESYEIVRRICGDSTSPGKYPIQFKDSVNYFGINLGNQKRWFLRLFFDGRKKAIVTRIPVERASPLAPGFEIDAPPSNIGKSRVYIGGLKDLERLRPLVLLAYEDQIRRTEAEASDEDDAPNEGGSSS